MKKLLFLSPLLFIACVSQNDTEDILKTIENTPGMRYVKPEIQKSMDEKHLEGSVLVYNLNKDAYYSNNYEWASEGFLPASTFKIVNSIIGIESGVVDDDSTMFEWDGFERALDSWEKDMTFKQAFHESCVPCYQVVARDIGTERMNKYLDKLDYGKMDVREKNIDFFWLEGDSEITQFKQIEFLKRLHNSKLPISQRTEKIIKRMIVREETNDYVLRGKTGFSITEDVWNGWFVGYVEYDKNVYFFATNVQPENPMGGMAIGDFTRARLGLTYELLKDLGIPIKN